MGEYLVDDELHIPSVLRKFDRFLHEHASSKDSDFLERECCLLFLSYLSPIVNGHGYVFKEAVVGDERRVDLVVTFNNKRSIVELKIWRGEKYHEKGLQQLCDYLDVCGENEGFSLIFDFRADKTTREAELTVRDKRIHAVWV